MIPPGIGMVWGSFRRQALSSLPRSRGVSSIHRDESVLSQPEDWLHTRHFVGFTMMRHSERCRDFVLDNRIFAHRRHLKLVLVLDKAGVGEMVQLKLVERKYEQGDTVPKAIEGAQKAVKSVNWYRMAALLLILASALLICVVVAVVM